MLYYFKLQFKVINRYLIDFGFPLLIGYVSIFVLFFLFSNYLFENTEHHDYIYSLLSLIFVVSLNDRRKRNFLTLQFKKYEVFIIRVFENILVSMPFLLFLLYKSRFTIAISLLVLNLLLAVFSFKNDFSFVIPTPFAKYPFEFLIGFRRKIGFIVISYFFTYLSIVSSNPNLGFFAILLIPFTCSLFYTYPEKIYFVWIFSMTSNEFLKEKITIAIKYSLLLSLPITITLSYFFFNEIILILFFQCIGLIFIVLVLLGKYSVYPKKIDLPQALGIILSIWLPPVIFFIIPYFYNQSIKRLNKILK